MKSLIMGWRSLGLFLLFWVSGVHARDSVILVLGDSLSAAYGIAIDQGWVAQLQQRLDTEKRGYQVVNASITGETTHGGLTRLAPLLSEHQPAIVIVELGANDGLRGQPVDDIRENLRTIVAAAKHAGAKVLLVPMRLPPNFGPVYVRRFESTYAELSRSESIPVSTFILEGVADRPELIQEDHLHPRAEAQSRMLSNIWPGLEPML
jgi:acyl-CoA thioesterase-1